MIDNQAGLTAGLPYYLSDTGTISSTVGDWRLGVAKDTDEIDIGLEYLPKELVNGGNADSLHGHGAFVEDSTYLTTGNKTDATYNTTIAIEVGFAPRAFTCTIDLGICGETWAYGSNASVRRTAKAIGGSIQQDKGVTISYASLSSAAVPPVNLVSMNPFYTSGVAVSNGQDEFTLSAVSFDAANTAGAVASLNSIAVSGTQLIFSFTATKNGASSYDLLYGVRSLMAF